MIWQTWKIHRERENHYLDTSVCRQFGVFVCALAWDSIIRHVFSNELIWDEQKKTVCMVSAKEYHITQTPYRDFNDC